MGMRTFYRCLAVVILVGVSVCTVFLYDIVYAAEEEVTSRIGILAPRGAKFCLKRWSHTARYLTDNIEGVSFDVIPLDYKEVNEVVEGQKVDFILVNPSNYVALEMIYSVERIATLKGFELDNFFSVFGGVIFTRADNTEVTKFGDLKNKRFMAVDEYSFGGWITSWRALKERDIDPYRDFATLAFSGTNDSVVYAVRDGVFDAGAVRTDTLERMAQEGKIDIEAFRVIGQTEEHPDSSLELHQYFPFLHSTRLYPEWPFAKLKHTKRDLAEEVVVTLLSMDADHMSAVIGNYAGWTVPLNYQSVHECLKELRIEPYQHFGKITLAGVIKEYLFWLVAIIMLLISMAAITSFVSVLNRRLKHSQVSLRNEILVRQKVEEAVTEKEERFRGLVESTSDWVWEVGENAIYTYTSPKVKELLGYEPEEIIGKTPFDLMPPNEAKWVFNQFQRMVESRKPFAGLENKNIHKDGHIVVLESSGVPIIDAAGNFLGYRGVDRDITARRSAEEELSRYRTHLEELVKERTEQLERELTERRQTERALQKSEKKYRQLYESLRDASAAVDMEGRIVEFNHAFQEMLGYNIDEIYRLTYEDITPPAWHPIEKKILEEQVRVRGYSDVYEKEYIRKDGTTFPVDLRTYLITDDAGEPLGMWALIRDITERKRAEAELTQLKDNLEIEVEKKTNDLVQAQRRLVRSERLAAMGQLGGTIAHEFRNQLGVIKNVAFFLKMKLKTEDKKVQKHIQVLEDEIIQTDRTIENILTFARTKEPEYTKIDLPRFIEIVVNKAKLKKGKGIEIDTECSEGVSDVDADEVQLMQICDNLILNALEAMGEEGRLRIKVARDDSFVNIMFEDSGPGINKDVQERIFEPLFTTKSRGAGLGLSTVKILVEHHEGTIDVSSEEGKGTCITVRLPIRKEEKNEGV